MNSLVLNAEVAASIEIRDLGGIHASNLQFGRRNYWSESSCLLTLSLTK